MAAETADLRIKTRRVKNHILTRYLALADKIDTEKPLTTSERETYNNLTLTFARNVIPRTNEHGGDPDNETPIPILNMNVPTDNSNSKDSPPHKAD
jgi:hypothetical protein